MMKLWYSSAVKPGSCVRPPNTAVSPRKKIVGASTPGIAAPGTRMISLRARRTSCPHGRQVAPRVNRRSSVSALPVTRPASAAGAARSR